jgi:hypothetical protein
MSQAGSGAKETDLTGRRGHYVALSARRTEPPTWWRTASTASRCARSHDRQHARNAGLAEERQRRSFEGSDDEVLSSDSS